MLNLLFISHSPRAELLRTHFQQQLKMRVDLVTDFDHGLKDVFEKRPAVVCIQEQIAGVTGESVARHIQLLLGAGAPAFVLLHDASGKARAIPGLFEYVVDLAQPFEAVCSTLTQSLQLLLGSHWELLYQPQTAPEPPKKADADAQTSMAVHDDDDFLAETSIFNPERAKPLPKPEPDPADFSGLLDDAGVPAPAAPSPPTGAPPPVVPAQPAVTRPAAPAAPPRPAARKHPPAVTDTSPEQQADMPQHDGAAELPVDELLQAFEDNYLRRRRLVRAVLCAGLLLVIAALVWYGWSRRSAMLHKSPPVQQAARPAAAPAPPVPPVQTPVSTARPSAAVNKAVPPPPFIPLAGIDPAYGKDHPGWSRYRDAKREFRLYQADGRLQALQVLTDDPSGISSAELKRMLQQLTGTDQYRVTSQKWTKGMLLQHARIGQQAELLLYRTSTHSPIRAFVFAPL